MIEAADGAVAMQIAVAHEGTIHLLLTDVIMPGMNGAALAKEVRSLRPETKILYMTGYSGEFIRTDMLTPCVSLIRKPFTSAELGRKIGKMLGDKQLENLPDAAPSPKIPAAAKAAAARTSG